MTPPDCQIGSPCDDGDPCTVGDYYDADCNCISDIILPDSDNDGVCDENDPCPDDATNSCVDADFAMNQCQSQAVNANYEYIQQVVFGTINNLSNNNNGYGDYTNMSTTITSNMTLSLTLTPGFANVPYVENWRVWIDFNYDNDFEDDGEMIFSGSSKTILSELVVMPSNLLKGTTRMRVAMQWNQPPATCGSLNYGEVEDYTIKIEDCSDIENMACNDNDDCTINDFYDADCNCVGTLVDSDADGLCDQRDPCPDDATNTCETPTAYLVYCDMQANNAKYEYIQQVVFGDINYNSGSDGGYGNHTSQQTQVIVGNSYTIELIPGFTSKAYRENWKVWIDMNLDGSFSDEEVVFTAVGKTAQSGIVSIPENSKLGNTRMRVAMQWKNEVTNPCEDIAYGEVEDYSIIISTNTNNTPSNLLSKNRQSSTSSIKVYPNPVKEVLTIDLGGYYENSQLKIINPTGQEVYQQHSIDGHTSITYPTATLPAGLYTIIVYNQEMNPKVIHVVKQ